MLSCCSDDVDIWKKRNSIRGIGEGKRVRVFFSFFSIYLEREIWFLGYLFFIFFYLNGPLCYVLFLVVCLFLQSFCFSLFLVSKNDPLLLVGWLTWSRILFELIIYMSLSLSIGEEGSLSLSLFSLLDSWNRQIRSIGAPGEDRERCHPSSRALLYFIFFFCFRFSCSDRC